MVAASLAGDVSCLAAQSFTNEFAAYAGSASCRDCHRADYDLWAQSHHALAERPLEPSTDRRAFDPPRQIKHGDETTTVQITNGIYQVVTLGLERFLVGCLRPASFHPDLKFPPARRRVLANAVLSQQTVHAQPIRAMLRGRQIPAQTTPGICQEPVGRRDEPGPHRIQMNIIANRAEITAAITLDNQCFVAPAEHMAEKLVPMVQPNRIGAQEPGHAGHQVGIGGFDDQMKRLRIRQ